MLNQSITRPALRYFGGKFRLASWIAEQFPPHTAYVEPFGGAANVILRKPPSTFEVYNDLDGEVTNFFRILRERSDELIRMIELTPYSREEQQLAFETSEDDLERARRLYIRCWQSHGGGRTQWRTGWRYQVNNTRGKCILQDWNQVDHLWAIVARLKQIQIENDDAFRVIKRFDRDDTLFYLDPPYLPLTRSIRWRKKAYTFEMTDDEHKRLAELLSNIKGMAIISGKPSELYDQMLAGWRVLRKTVPTDFNSTTVECLWISPNADARIRQLRMEL
jgi:DNA adenine methylase